MPCYLAASTVQVSSRRTYIYIPRTCLALCPGYIAKSNLSFMKSHKTQIKNFHFIQQVCVELSKRGELLLLLLYLLVVVVFIIVVVAFLLFLQPEPISGGFLLPTSLPGSIAKCRDYPTNNEQVPAFDFVAK